VEYDYINTINALNNQEKTQMVLDGAVSYIFIVTGNQMFTTIICNKHLVSFYYSSINHTLCVLYLLYEQEYGI
jgi:hypothetical protein